MGNFGQNLIDVSFLICAFLSFEVPFSAGTIIAGFSTCLSFPDRFAHAFGHWHRRRPHAHRPHLTQRRLESGGGHHAHLSHSHILGPIRHRRMGIPFIARRRGRTSSSRLSFEHPSIFTRFLETGCGHRAEFFCVEDNSAARRANASLPDRSA